MAARRGSLDDSAYYQAQVDSLNRDNRMLRARIRVLERQITELSTSSSAAAAVAATSVEPTTTAAVATGNSAGASGAAARDEPQATEKNIPG